MLHSARASAYPPSQRLPREDWRDDPDAALPLMMRPEDRIDGRPPRRRGRLLSGLVVILLGIGGAMVALDDRVRELLPAMPELPALASWLPRPASSERPAVEKASMDRPLPELPGRVVAAVEEPAGSVPREPAAPAPTNSAAAEVDGRPEPLPPPQVDTADPLQVKAAAVGLHPELSPALLQRLSAEDFRNAGIAITTALAETPNTGVYLYPTQRKPEQALFRIHFVKGAPADCRRYVVTVTKDRWATTALPMERCGAAASGRGRAP